MRGALLAVCFVLSACGGGGGGEPVASQSVPAPVVQAPAAQVPAAQAPVVQPPAVQPPAEVPAAAVDPAPSATAPAPAPTPAASAPQPEPAPAPVPEPPAPVATPPVLSSNIAAWGDSLTRGYAPKLAAVYPDRIVFNGGVGGETSPQIRTRMVADTEKANWITVLWYGRNNWQWQSQVLHDLDLSVRALAPGNGRFIVMPVFNASTQRAGTADYNKIMMLNEAIAAAYPNNYLDIRSYLVSKYDPTNPQDVIDQSFDVVPASLRTDIVHLTPAGYQLVADRVKQFIEAKGW